LAKELKNKTSSARGGQELEIPKYFVNKCRHHDHKHLFIYIWFTDAVKYIGNLGLWKLKKSKTKLLVKHGTKPCFISWPQSDDVSLSHGFHLFLVVTEDIFNSISHFQFYLINILFSWLNAITTLHTALTPKPIFYLHFDCGCFSFYQISF